MSIEKTQIDIYIDLETTDTVAGAGIWDVGAIAYHDWLPLAEFSTLCRPSGTKSRETLDWIRSQPAVAAQHTEALLSAQGQTEVLLDLHEFLSSWDPSTADVNVYTWRQFDGPLLSFAFRRLKLQEPWHYSNLVDLSAVAKFLNTDIRPDTSTHQALADAKALRACHVELVRRMQGLTNG